MKTDWLKKKTIFVNFAVFPTLVLLLWSGMANAWHADGFIFCDANQDRQIDNGDTPLENVEVDVVNTTGTFTGSDLTDANGYFRIDLPKISDSFSFIETLDEVTLPVDATYVIPATGEFSFGYELVITRNWLIDSAICREEAGCRVTGGGNATAGIDPSGGWDGTLAEDRSHGPDGINRYTFGGQAGANTGAPPQPAGEWTHHQQSGPDGSFVFHGGTSSAPPGTEIDQIICSDEGWCDPAREAPTKQIDFDGVGTFKNIKNPSTALANVVPGVTYHWFEVHIEDLGEPGKGKSGDLKPGSAECPLVGSGTDAFADPPVFQTANCGCSDFYRIRIYAGVIPAFDPITGEITNLDKTNIIYEVFGYIDGGNFQIHPPTGFDLR